MSDIFISYANEDRSRAQMLAQELEGQGWSIFWDRTIPTGKTWRVVIGKELNEARCVLVLWSKVSIESRWVQEEADDGERRGILVPVLIEKVQPPIGFRSIQAADLSEWDATEPTQAFHRLITDIAGLIRTAAKDAKEETERKVEEAEVEREAEAAESEGKLAEAERREKEVRQAETERKAKAEAKRTQEPEERTEPEPRPKPKPERETQPEPGAVAKPDPGLETRSPPVSSKVEQWIAIGYLVCAVGIWLPFGVLVDAMDLYLFSTEPGNDGAILGSLLAVGIGFWFMKKKGLEISQKQRLIYKTGMAAAALVALFWIFTPPL